jgi:(p)ppGpp synthase/HD superfamily hydrolase
MSDLEKALSIAVEAHRGQKDRNGDPYILHPIRVMCRVTASTARIVAILHDVVEDTDWTFERLAAEGFGPDVLHPLDCVTKREGEDYEDFVRRSASDPVAREVKLADLEDNMDVRRLSAVGANDTSRLDKYVRAWRFLRGGA